MSKCKDCKLYVGNCGMHPLDDNDHILYDESREKECKCFDEYKEIKYQFTFNGNTMWEPGSPVCWTDCPFRMMIPLGDSCKYRNKLYVCPFTVEGALKIVED